MPHVPRLLAAIALTADKVNALLAGIRMWDNTGLPWPTNS
jgi:hypothetical protein